MKKYDKQKYIIKTTSLLSLLFFVLACQNGGISFKNSDSNNSFATYFSVAQHEGYAVLRIKEAWQGSGAFTYVLQSKEVTMPDSLKSYPLINVPLKNIVVTSTTHLAALEMLGVENKLIAFPNTQYVSSELFRKRIDEGKIQEIGNGMQLNTEKVLTLHPDLIMGFSSGEDAKNYTVFQKNNIPVLFNADWLEKSPLGRAEWLKIFGLLFDKTQLADSLFNQIAVHYKTIQSKAKTSKHPIVFQGGQFGDKWYVPGGSSYAVRLINDAGGQYAWQDDQHTGSVSLNFENVLLKLSRADIWLNPGMIENQEQLFNEIPQSKQFLSFEKNNIYSYNLTKGKTGGVIYFESSNAHPDWVLDDLFHIFNPQTNSDYTFQYYKQLP